MISPYVRAELRRAVRPHHLGLLLLGVALAVVDAALTPRIPELALDFLRASLHLRTMADLILVNDYLAQYMIVVFAGAFDLLRVYVGPAESRELDLYLAKPLGRAHLLAARSAPALAAVALLGLGISAANALTLRLWLGDVALAPVLAAGAVITALAVALLALLNLIFLRLREVEHAVLLAFVVAVAPLLPTSALIYRPDLFAAEPSIAAAFPASLLWSPAALPVVAAGSAVVATLLAALLVALAARRLGRRPDF